MRHQIILAHPNPESFNASIARTYADAVRALGHEANIRDLYALDFDPRLGLGELPWWDEFAVPAEVAREREAVKQAQVLVLVYPLWFNAPPAMLKGYVERVLGFGFGYGPDDLGTRPLLTGTRLVSISTSGAPDGWVEQTGVLKRLRQGFDDHLAEICGFAVIDHLHIGGITPGMRRDAGAVMLGRVDALAERHFAPATSGLALT